MRKMFLVLLLLTAMSAAGCAFHHNIPMADIQIPPSSLRKKVPIKVAIELPSESSVFTKTNSSGGQDTIPSGRLLRKFATETLPEIFDETEFIDRKPYPQDVSAVIIPVIENFSFEGIQVALGFGMKFSSTITLKATMVTPDGMRIWSRVVKATKTSRDVVSPVIPVDQLIGESTAMATLEAFREMAKEISYAKEVNALAGSVKPQKQVAVPVYTPPQKDDAPVIVVSPPSSSTDKLPAARTDAHAVVIGIDYKNRNDMPNLNYASADAKKVYDILTDLRYGGIPKENAVLLLNEKATRSEMIAALRKIRSWDGYVYVFFSGHGAPKTKGDKFVDAFLIPSDVLISDPEAMEETAITVSYLQELIDKSKAKGVLLALDACFSGGGKSILPKGGKPLVGMIAVPEIIKPAASGSKVVITSSAVNQQSWEDDSEIKGGIFSHYLIEGLKGKAGKDVWVKADELAEYLKASVPNAAYKLKRMEQTPQVYGSGDFFVTRNWQKAKVEDIDIARGRLKNTFEKGYITAEQLSKAMDDLKKPVRSKLLNSFLDGKITDKQFGELY